MKMIYTMVGMQYRGTENLVGSLKPGTGLSLRRAPDNPFDANAVEVWYGGAHVAFIKGTEVKELARMMDRNGDATINGIFTIGGDRWPQVEVDTR